MSSLPSGIPRPSRKRVGAGARTTGNTGTTNNRKSNAVSSRGLLRPSGLSNTLPEGTRISSVPSKIPRLCKKRAGAGASIKESDTGNRISSAAASRSELRAGHGHDSGGVVDESGTTAFGRLADAPEAERPAQDPLFTQNLAHSEIRSGDGTEGGRGGDIASHNKIRVNTIIYVYEDGLAKKVRDWLAPPDSSRNWDEGQKKRLDGTCTWFLESDKFSTWKKDAGFLWVKGKGSGKSILCSSVLDTLSQQEPQAHMAYFFFDGRDAQIEQQHHHKLLRSLISLISHQADKETVPRPLVDLYNRAKARQPTDKELEETLTAILMGLPEAYIVIDALDECKAEDRKFTLRWLADISAHKHQNLHILVTSRPEYDIVEALNKIPMVPVDMNEGGPSGDITKYLEEQLASNKFRKYDQDTQNTITSKLVKGAEGSFRWAALQIAELEKCASVYEVTEQLEMLPHGLDEVYSRILKAIDPRHYKDVKTILQFLAFSFQPLSLQEVAEAVTVDFNSRYGPVYKQEKRYQEPQEILRRCSSLVVETEGFVKLSHFSVKEFLLRSSAPESFQLNETESHLAIADISIAYLLQFESEAKLSKTRLSASPLAEYAAHYWIAHTKKGETHEAKITFSNAIKLFAPTNAFFNWVYIWDIDDWIGDQKNKSGRDKIGPPLYYACLSGFQNIVQHILQTEYSDFDINQQGGTFGNALRAASFEGHLEIVSLLLEKGADVNAQGGFYGNALQAAIYRGHLEIVSLLLEKGADVNAQGGEYGNALQAASYQDHLEIVNLLLEKGADVNAQGGFYGYALRAASYQGHLEIVRLLLEKGADVNAQGGYYGNALQVVSSQGHLEIVNLLLEKGADVNAQGGFYGNALQAAIYRGHLEIVSLLLEKGADVNAHGGYSENALLAASYGGHLEIVNLLLEKGADVNAQGGFYGYALQRASSQGHLEIVNLLLEKGADVNAQGEYYGNALQRASSRGHLEIVNLLLEKGADVNAQGGFYGNALQAAIYQGHLEIVSLLLEKGADVNAQGGEYGNALQAASARGHLDMVKLLLEKGADVNALGGKYGNALKAALSGEHQEVHQLLVEHGALEEFEISMEYFGNLT